MPTRTIRMMIATISCGCGPIMVGDGVASMFAAEARRSEKLGNTKAGPRAVLVPVRRRRDQVGSAG